MKKILLIFAFALIGCTADEVAIEQQDPPKQYKAIVQLQFRIVGTSLTTGWINGSTGGEVPYIEANCGKICCEYQVQETNQIVYWREIIVCKEIE